MWGRQYVPTFIYDNPEFGLFYKVVCIACNDVFLVCGNHDGCNRGIGGRDNSVFAGGLVVEFHIHFDAEALHVFQYGDA